MLDKCPGAADMRTPTLKIKNCPECNCEVELFSVDINGKCPCCGFVVYNDIESCIQWCKHAIECVGEDVYNKMVEKRKSDD